MHLERTKPQAAETEISQPVTIRNGAAAPLHHSTRSSRRGFLLGASALLVGTALAGCSTGTSRDAERGKEEDASRESVVKDMQATETWNLVNGTPPAGTATPDE